MTERTKDLLKQAGAIAMVFLSGGTAMMNLYLYLYRFPATHANAYEGSLGKMVFAILLAFVFGWLAIRPRKRSQANIPVPIRIESGTRMADAEGRIYITTEDIDVGDQLNV